MPVFLRRLGLFIRHLFHQWVLLLVLFLSLVSTAATYLPVYMPHFHISRIFPLAVAFLAFMGASFRVFCGRLDSEDALEKVGRTHESHLCELRRKLENDKAKVNEGLQVIEDLEAKIHALSEENTRLRVKPYDEQRLRHVRAMLSELSWPQRDLMRFLVINGDCRIDVIHRAARSESGPVDIGQLCNGPVTKGLLTREDDHINGYATISVKPIWREILPDLLFPREEVCKPPLFNGIAN